MLSKAPVSSLEASPFLLCHHWMPRAKQSRSVQNNNAAIHVPSDARAQQPWCFGMTPGSRREHRVNRPEKLHGRQKVHGSCDRKLSNEKSQPVKDQSPTQVPSAGHCSRGGRTDMGTWAHSISFHCSSSQLNSCSVSPRVRGIKAGLTSDSCYCITCKGTA